MGIKRIVGLFGILLLSFFLLVSCAGQRSKTKTGAAAGAVAGAAIGAVVGHQSGHELEGAAIGAAAGALVGGGIGHYLDRQAQELRQIEELEVRREQDSIIATV
ncbi:MAG: glycine zipper 2TM domain-containing protein, partial [Deltaproteobacteria bacterium]|nr:glycine zipper 2TM domain-containing protein [Deltaproteobacteria bacterium]